MQDAIALLEILVERLFSHPDSKSPHLVIQVALQKSGIILQIMHGLHDLKNLVS